MKRAKAKSRPRAKRTAAQGESGAADVERYLTKVPEPARSTLQRVRGMIKAAAPQATEAISYGIPAFKHNGMLVAYAAFAKHCSFFPASGEALEEFAEELRDYPCSKGTIRFAVDKPLPSALIKKLVRARVEKNAARAAAKDANKKRH